ncbi:MAG: PfaB family protein [Proteobacteria bacterium]|nr:PfaB family protein [Pseudomonadota bacterium]
MHKIAVIGISCLFPGAETPEQFMQNLIDRKDSTSPATEEQMGVAPETFYSPKSGETDKYYSQKGGYIRDFTFDPHGYNLPDGLVERLDDVYQWSLYVSREALKDSGYLGKSDMLSKCGIILGNLSFPTKSSNRLFLPIYHKAVETSARELLKLEKFQLAEEPLGDQADFTNGRISGYPAAVVARALSLSGMYYSMDAACSSSLYSVKLACDYLNTGQADLMLAGAVSAGDPFFVNQGFSTFTAYPKTGESKPLDNNSDGLVSGEGAGMFVLKRYNDALRDGDRIYASICSIGLSNDGRGRSVLRGNPKGHILAYERAYAQTKVAPESIGYIECHATGTPVGDPVEMESLDTFFGRYGAHPLVGSVKANFGHLLTAAGMASMLKVILSMSQGLIPATIKLDDPVSSPNNVIASDQVVAANTPWPDGSAVKHAAVNAIGFGGTNAHLIFQHESEERLADVRKSAAAKKVRKSKKQKAHAPMAIVGMDAIFGSSKNLDDFDYSIYAKTQHFIPLPPNRWKGLEDHRSLLERYGFETGEAPRGGFIDNFDWDVPRFRIPPNEVDAMIPQQLLMLKVADDAIRDAKLKEGSNVGVIVAMEADKTLHQFRGRIDLTWRVDEALDRADANLSSEEASRLQDVLKGAIRSPVRVNEFTSFIGNIMANRISAQWDFSGPSFTLSSEENSVFKALDAARMLLDAGEVEAVVVGGVDLAGNVEDVLVRNQLMEKTNAGIDSMGLNRETDGWLVGEGAGAVVLRQHETAKKERNKCYALIDSISLQRGNSVEVMESTCRKALKAAGVKASDIGYLEVSGAGGKTETEIEALVETYGSSSSEPTCAIGSVTANIGHTFAASGMASLIKTALCLYRRYIPAVPQWSTPKLPELWENNPFYVATESKTWFLTKNTPKRIAAINGGGFDGTSAHLVLSEDTAPMKRSSSFLKKVPFYLFPLVADDRAALTGGLESLRRRIEETDDLSMVASRQYADTLENSEAKYALAILGDTREKILQEIEAASSGILSAFERDGEWLSPQGSYFTAKPLGKEGKLAYVYPGAFNSYVGMGRDIFQLYPELYDLIATYSSRPQHLLRDRLVYPRSLNAQSARELNEHQTRLEENAIATFETGINAAILNTAVMRGVFSLQPDAAFGYSMGEVSMTFSLGVWGSTDSMSETLHTHPIFLERLAGPMKAAREAWGLPPADPNETESIWACYTMGASAAEVKKAIEKEKHVYLIIVNSPKEVIIAGETNACRRVVESMDCRSVLTPMSDTIHCDIVKPDYDNVANLHTEPAQSVPPIDFYSAADYGTYEMTTEKIADNIAKIYCGTIDFPKLVDKVYQDGTRVFLELGPKGSCTKFIDDILADREHLAVTMDRKGADDHSSILRALAQLFGHRVSMDLSMLYPRDAVSDPRAKTPTRSITLGGKRIADSILTTENREEFRDTPLSKSLQPPPEITVETSAALKPSAEVSVATPMEADRIQPSQVQSSAPPPTDLPRPLPAGDASSATIRHLQERIGEHQAHIGRGHAAFLQARNASLQQLRETIRLQMIVEARSQGLDAGPVEPVDVVWDEADLLEFAGGKIANVFGQEYEIIDTYKYRVRLPLPPYLLVNRVVGIDAQRGEFRPSSLTTEYDVPRNAWYSVDAQIPWAIASEAGQCDLLLISYLGIDFQSQGHRYYRLTDYTMTFMDELPKEGDTLRYEIKIDSFMKSGEALFFNFGYECFVEGKMVYQMTGGRAGFSTDEELAQGKGVILSKMEEETRRRIPKQHFTPLLECPKTSFTRDELLNITRGNIGSCFGPQYDQGGANPSLRFASEEIMMIDRIVSVDRNGGPWGLGEITAEKDLAPDHWYFPCHFKDDNVLAGTLVTEGCVQLLEFYLLYLGLQVKTRDARFQPVRNRPYAIRARGQIVPTDTRYSYKMEITEIGLNPRPFARANFYIILEGKVVVDFRDLGVELVEKTPADPAYGSVPTVIPSPVDGPRHSPTVVQPMYTWDHITEFATGSLAKCFGPEYEIYEGRRAPRTPNGDLQLISRVLEVNGIRHDFKSDANLTSEYDVPADAWFYQQNSCPVMPYSMLMEIALQPCGFLATYMGATMIYSDLELCFRNLGADAVLIKDVDLRGKTITAWSKLLSVAKAVGMIILNFDFELRHQGEVFYQGTTQFGYHTPEALSMQKGLDKGEIFPPWFQRENLPTDASIHIDLRSPEARAYYYDVRQDKPYYRLGGPQFDFLDEAYLFPNSGRYGQGFIYGCKKVDPTDWFYPCHFFQDPVMPGSLGVESILQAMRIFALQQDLGRDFRSPCFTNVPDQIQWKYRGQIVPENDTMDIEVHIKSVDRGQGYVVIKADADLMKDKLRIYTVTDAAIALVET